MENLDDVKRKLAKRRIVKEKDYVSNRVNDNPLDYNYEKTV